MSVEVELDIELADYDFEDYNPVQEAMKVIFRHCGADKARLFYTLTGYHSTVPKMGKCVLITYSRGLFAMEPIEPGGFLSEPVPENWMELCDKGREEMIKAYSNSKKTPAPKPTT
jgi:hypothetical protein